MTSRQSLIIAVVDVPQNINSGDYFYRTFSPGIALSQEERVHVVSISKLHPRLSEVLENADVVVLNDICDPDFFPVISERKKKKLPTLFEIADDMNGLQPWNPVYNFYQNEENIRLIYRLANYCDGLQFSVSELQRLYGQLNKNSRVFENQLLNIPPLKKRQFDGNLVVGWGGSHGHMDDMAAIANPLMDWIQSRSDIKLHLMCSKPISDLFIRMPAPRIRHFPTGSIDDYYNFLSTIHIGIAPLNDTPFNRARSDVKFLEYAVSGVAPILAKVESYKNSVRDGETGFLYTDISDLITKLTFLAEDQQVIRDISTRAREYVIAERQQSAHISTRLSFYRTAGPRQISINGNAEDLFKRWSSCASAKRSGRFLSLHNTEFEKYLFSGLLMMGDSGKRSEAMKCFQKGFQLEPRNYLPCLFKSRISPDSITDLSQAIRLEPRSIKAHILLGEEHARNGRIVEAIDAFNRAANIYPEYDVPFFRAGDLLKKIGKDEQAEKLYQIALSRQISLS